ncbi:MAG: hypothetical protein AAB368_13525, partial [bacterium]
SNNSGFTLVSSNVITAILAPGTTHLDTGLANGIPHYYRLTARDVSGNNSPGSAEVSATPTGSAVAIPSGLTMLDLGEGTTEQLSWNADPNATIYYVLRSVGDWPSGSPPEFVPGAINPDYAPILTVSVPITGPVQVGGLTRDLRYWFVVVASNTLGGKSSQLAGVSRNTNPPATPTGLSATTDKIGLVTVGWSKNTEADLKGYRLYASLAPSVSTAGMTLIADESPSSLGSGVVSFTDTFAWSSSPKDVGAVYYRIVAVDAVGNVSASAPDPDGIRGVVQSVIPAPGGEPIKVTIPTTDGVMKELKPGKPGEVPVTANARPTFGGRVDIPPGTTVQAGSTFIQVELKVKGYTGGATSITQRV